jgi:hypothetical protein
MQEDEMGAMYSIHRKIIRKCRKKSHLRHLEL